MNPEEDFNNNELEENEKRKNKRKIILILLLLLLFLIVFIISYRIGKIGYSEVSGIPKNIVNNNVHIQTEKEDKQEDVENEIKNYPIIEEITENEEDEDNEENTVKIDKVVENNKISKKNKTNKTNKTNTTVTQNSGGSSIASNDKNVNVEQNKNQSQDNTQNQGQQSEQGKDESQNQEQNVKLIEVTDDKNEITQSTKLDIFKNKKFDGEKIIAPESNGTYKFCLKNVSGKNLVYDIDFSEAMNYQINMKYKLKLDGVYIKGNNEKYVDIAELNAENLIIPKDSNSLYILEWYWENDDISDTLVGSQKTDEYYTLNFEINATEYN